MKNSKYNYILSYESNYILFNGLTRKLIKIPNTHYEIFKELLRNLDVLKDRPVLKEKLLNGGFVVEKEVNEIDRLLELHNQSVESKNYILTILPTFYCNFSCWYCPQSHREEYMNDNIVQTIKNHISKYLTDNAIEEFMINWFGGEPLLCFDNHIVDICLFAQKFCAKHNIKFTNSITTNGYLINEDIANQMNDLNFSIFQITIDGVRDNHNLVRNENGKPSFDKILKNIALIAENIPEATIFLRFNYTDTNLDIEQIVSEVNEIIPQIYRAKIHILPRKVWQIDKSKIEPDIEDFVDSSFSVHGYQICNAEISGDYINCYASKKHHHVVYHDGSIDKCTNVDPNEAVYKLSDTGDVVVKDKIIDVLNPFSSNSRCFHCKHLPVCLGPCIKGLRLMINGDIECIHNNSDKPIMESILHYCIQEIQNDN